MLFSLKNVPKGKSHPSGWIAGRQLYVKHLCIRKHLELRCSHRGELVNENTVKRTIYWNYPDSRPAVTWINHNTVKIGNQTLTSLTLMKHMIGEKMIIDPGRTAAGVSEVMKQNKITNKWWQAFQLFCDCFLSFIMVLTELGYLLLKDFITIKP